HWRHRTYCRGGPPWPPLVGKRILEIDGLGVGEHDFNRGRPLRAAPTVRSEILVTLALCNGNDLVNRGNVERFKTAVGPFDFELIDLRRRAQPEVQRHIILRTKNRATENILTLSHTPRRQIRNRANRIARALLRNVTN